MVIVGSLVAHQGGWDEMLLVAVPILVFYAILRLAKRRADRLEPHDPTPTSPPTDVRPDS